MNTNARIECGPDRANANAANANVITGEILLAHGHIRDVELQIHGVVNQLGVQLILTEGCNRDWRVLYGRLNLGRSDNDFLKLGP